MFSIGGCPSNAFRCTRSFDNKIILQLSEKVAFTALAVIFALGAIIAASKNDTHSMEALFSFAFAMSTPLFFFFLNFNTDSKQSFCSIRQTYSPVLSYRLPSFVQLNPDFVFLSGMKTFVRLIGNSDQKTLFLDPKITGFYWVVKKEKSDQFGSFSYR